MTETKSNARRLKRSDIDVGDGNHAVLLNEIKKETANNKEEKKTK